jgi:hypothetical protein
MIREILDLEKVQDFFVDDLTFICEVFYMFLGKY